MRGLPQAIVGAWAQSGMVCPGCLWVKGQALRLAARHEQVGAQALSQGHCGGLCCKGWKQGQDATWVSWGCSGTVEDGHAGLGGLPSSCP